eukprot:gb/GEZN01009638.1/.p1 GENE.gb/GEZN01009638.1/~~gb/GEZN01009638.1/.p1  ORF type:complete len:386 (-),score=83.91 gb/GEZN01009638.1/:130-1287(-)
MMSLDEGATSPLAAAWGLSSSYSKALASSPPFSALSMPSSVVYHPAPGDDQVLTVGTVKQMLMAHGSRQEKINKANARMQSLNFLIHMSTASRLHGVQQQYGVVKHEIKEGQKRLLRLQQEVAVQADQLEEAEAKVAALGQDVQQQQEQCQALSKDLEQQRTKLTETILDYDAKLTRQEALLQEQDHALKVLLAERLRAELGVEAGLFCLALWLSGRPLLQFPARAVLSVLWTVWYGKKKGNAVTRRSRKARYLFLMALTRLAMIWTVLRQLRSLAMSYGLLSLPQEGHSKQTTYYHVLQSLWHDYCPRPDLQLLPPLPPLLRSCLNSFGCCPPTQTKPSTPSSPSSAPLSAATLSLPASSSFLSSSSSACSSSSSTSTSSSPFP